MGAAAQAVSEKLPATQDPTEKDRRVWAYCAFAGTAATVLLFLITLLMIRRIMVAVATIKVGCLPGGKQEGEGGGERRFGGLAWAYATACVPPLISRKMLA